MVVRFFSALAGISMIVSFLVFLISYANYPDEVLVYVNSVGEPKAYLSKNLLFYILLAFLIVFNVVLLWSKGIIRNFSSETELSQIGIGITQIFFNFFFFSSAYFISIINNRENFDYSNFGYLIYVSGFLLTISVGFTLTTRFILKK